VSGNQVDTSWLLIESLRIGVIVSVGFLFAHLFGEVILAVGIELLYGVKNTLVAVIRYTTLITAILYATMKRNSESLSPTVLSDE